MTAPETSRDARSTRWTARAWAMTAVAAITLTLIVSLRNYFGYRIAGRALPFWFVLALELPVWTTWTLLMPVITRLALRFSLVGTHALRNALLHTVAGLAAAAIVITATTLARIPMGAEFVPPGMSFWSLIGQVYLAASLAFLFTYFAIVGVTLAWVYHQDRQEQRARGAQLETMLARAQRDMLRMQIHPHFLFNTMHAISALMATDVPAARRMMSRLSDLLRLSLDDDARHEVTLEEELEFLERYLDIQLIRFGDRITVEQAVEPAACTMLIPRLLLQPLVENSFVHGVGLREDAGTIRISAALENGDLVINIADDGPGRSQSESWSGGAGRALTRPGTGVGLNNSRARLQQLYGAAATIDLEVRDDGGGARTIVRLPAHRAPVGTGAE